MSSKIFKEDNMIAYLEEMLTSFRPAFHRHATFVWFVIVFIGFLVRTDDYGVSSIVRALWLVPTCYPCILHFFHSFAYTTTTLIQYWWQWLKKTNAFFLIDEKMVLIGDHTKNVKDGRKIPAVTTLYQDSETGSKPSFFRGHQWGYIGVLIKSAERFFSTPLWAEIHNTSLKESMAVRIVAMAIEISAYFAKQAILVLDGFFSIGPVFLSAKQNILILTKAKKNITAYKKPEKKTIKKRGRPAMYGEKLILMKLFDSASYTFKTMETLIYDKTETIRYLTIDLIWKPIKDTLRFFLIESSYGRMILMTNDFSLTVDKAILLYCNRVTIEIFFNVLKNLLGGLKYHFWSKYLSASSRRPLKNKKETPVSSNQEKTKNTLTAIEKFVLIQLIVVGTMQLLSIKFSKEIFEKSDCWLRTSSSFIPSLFITRIVLMNIVFSNLISFLKNPILQLIMAKQKKC